MFRFANKKLSQILELGSQTNVKCISIFSNLRSSRITVVKRDYISQRLSGKISLQPEKPSNGRGRRTIHINDSFIAKLAAGVIMLGVGIKTLTEHAGCQNECEEETDVKVNATGKVEKSDFTEAIRKGRDLAQRIKDETGSPGLVIAVSVDGKQVWSEGLGYADVENRVPMTPETVLRIASISKPITMAAIAKLCETGDLDLDKPVQHYVPKFPEKEWEGQKVTITPRQLVSHMGGIRHYDKSYMKKQKENETEQNKETKNKGDNQTIKDKTSEDENKSSVMDKVTEDPKGTKVGKLDENFTTNEAANRQNKDGSSGDNPSEKGDKSGTSEDNSKKEERTLSEYYIRKRYNSVAQSLDIFKDDPLVHKPETKFLYTTYGWTIISAVAESAAKMPFEKLIQGMLKELGMENTYLELSEQLVYNRGRHYVKNKRGRLQNAPYVDLSYKWAGGGLISNVEDIVRFGNAMLYSYQKDNVHTETGRPAIDKPGNVVASTGKDGEISGNFKTADMNDKTVQRTSGSTCVSNADGNETLMPKTAKEQSNVNSKIGGKNLILEKMESKSLKEKENKKLLINSSLTVTDNMPGYLKSDTMKLLWSPIQARAKASPDSDHYGMGWEIISEKKEYGCCLQRRFCVLHTGGAIGASSVLLILPPKPEELNGKGRLPQGIVVAIIANMTSVGLTKTAFKVAKEFEAEK